MISLIPGSILRSIPACTGEPRVGIVQDIEKEVYPRVYGGTHLQLLKGGWQDGLSPRVRGNLPSVRISIPRWRSIPACTGEPSWSRKTAGTNRVYPRVYGGTSKRSFFVESAKGGGLIVLHQVNPISVDYLLRRLS